MRTGLRRRVPSSASSGAPVCRPDGVAGPATRKALGRYGRHTLGSRPLERGLAGWDVAALQFLLAWHGFPSATFDGGLGIHTERALRRFQRWAGLKSDAVAGASTIAALRLEPATCPIALAWPLTGPVGDPFGPRGNRFHAGIDIVAAKGTPIAAAAPGRVSFAGSASGGWGKLVVLTNADHVRTLYAHLSAIKVRKGQSVSTGTRLGLVGSTGDATGPHLHFEVRLRGAAVDPFPRCRSDRLKLVLSELVAEKRYLMTPGPTPAPPEVLAAIAQPVIHHRGPDFRKLYSDCLGRLREVFRTESEVLLFGGSGTGAMESAVANLCSPGEPVLVVSAGYFGERWAGLARAYGTEVDHLRYAWGEIPSPADMSARLRERPATAVFLTHSETSTGVVTDLQPFAAAAREAGALSVVDAVSSLGAVPLETDAWGIDVVASGAQKALMTPPGLAMVSASAAAWEQSASASSPRFYWDWERTRKGQATLDAPVTPPVSLVAGLDVALTMLLEEGLEAAYERHVRLGRACREGLKAMGLELFSPDEDSSAVVTAARAPDGIDSSELVLLLRDRHGVTLAPGQGELKGKIFRIGHIGYYDVFDITTALAAVELALVELGAEIERGVAVTRALEAFEHTPV